MFHTVGGSYEGVDYSAMYHSPDKYLDVSPNEKYYIHLGNIDEDENVTQRYGILVFDIETDELVYGEETDVDYGSENYNQYHHRKAKELYDKLDWLSN